MLTNSPVHLCGLLAVMGGGSPAYFPMHWYRPIHSISRYRLTYVDHAVFCIEVRVFRQGRSKRAWS